MPTPHVVAVRQTVGAPISGQAAYLQNQHTTPVFSTGGSVQLSTRVNDVMRLISIGADFQWISGTDSAPIFN